MLFPFASLPPTFPLGVINPSVFFILAPPGQCFSKCWSKLEHRAGLSLGNLGYVGTCTLSLSGRGLRRDTRGYYQGVGTPGGLAGLVLPLSKCLVTGIPRLIVSSREKEYPSLTVRACDGLSWDTPAGFQLSKAVPAVMWQIGIC